MSVEPPSKAACALYSIGLPHRCEAQGGRWIGGEAAAAEAATEANESGGGDADGGSYAELECSKGCASLDCGDAGRAAAEAGEL